MYDIVIIGSGPAGLSSAIYAQRAGLKAVVVEKNYLGTGQIAESERVDNYPGLYGENGFDLGEKFRSHAESLGTEFIEGEAVKISKNTTDYSIELDNGNSLETHTVIYAVGTERRKLQVEGEKEFSGRGVSYCAVCDAAFYKDKITAVAGGGDTALGDAALLSKFAKKVYLIHRRDKFRANKTLQQKVENISNVEILLNSQIKRLTAVIRLSRSQLIKTEQKPKSKLTAFLLQSAVCLIRQFLRIWLKLTITAILLQMRTE